MYCVHTTTLTAGELQFGCLLRRDSLNQRNKAFVPMHIRNLEPTSLQDLSEFSFRPLQRASHVHHMRGNHVLEPITVLVQQDLSNVQPSPVLFVGDHVANVLQDLDAVVLEPVM